jgi:DNA replication protein DnaC
MSEMAIDQELTDEQKLERAQAELLRLRAKNAEMTDSMSAHTSREVQQVAARRTTCWRCEGPLPADRGRICAGCDEFIAFAQDDYGRRMASGEVDATLARSGLPRAYAKGERTLSDLPSSADEAIKACMQLGKEISGLYLFGPAKAMKTSVAAAFLAAQIRAGENAVVRRGVYVSAPKLIDDIIASYHDQDMERRTAIIDRLTQTPMLVIDDLGKEKATEHSARVLFEVLDGRFQNRGAGRWTIITSNWSPNDVAFRFDIPEEDRDPIRHRLAEITEAIEMRRAA